MKKIVLLVGFFGLLAFNQINDYHADVETYIEGADGRFIYTAPLYQATSSLPYEFQDVRDIYVTMNDEIYVIDENKLIVFRTEGQGQIIGENILNDPQAVTVNSDEIYIADKGAETVFVFNQNGEMTRQYDRPNEVFFGAETSYLPVDVEVSTNGIIYIASEGTADGLISLEQDGTFLNFYGANKSSESVYASFVLSNDLLPGAFKPKPPAITNIEIDNISTIYTLTENEASGVRKLNFDGNNVLENEVAANSSSTKDFYLDSYNNIFVINENYIESYNPQGDLLYTFEDNALESITEIAVDQNEGLYVYDAKLATIVYYVPVESAKLLYAAADLYYEGKLEQSVDLWEKFLDQRSNYALAYQGIGDFEYQERNYQESLDYYKKANSKEDYSAALFFVRQETISDNFLLVIIGLIAVIIMYQLIKRFAQKQIKYAKEKFGIIIELFHFQFQVLTKPKNVMYLIKYKNKFSVKEATFLYLEGIIVILLMFNFTSYLFKVQYPPIINNGGIVIAYFSVIAVILLCNRFVSSIMYSEATFHQMYRAFSLVIAPLVFLGTISVIVSYALTLNEQVIYSSLLIVMLLWMFIIFYNFLSEMHNYQFATTYKNIFATVFTIIVLIFVIVTIAYLTITLSYTVYQIFVEVG